jgi:hypothetical protein
MSDERLIRRLAVIDAPASPSADFVEALRAELMSELQLDTSTGRTDVRRGRWETLRASARLRAVAAVLVVVLAGALVAQRLQPARVAVPGTTPTPTATAAATLTPAPTRIQWTPAALREPFPFPLRSEPLGGAPVVDAMPSDFGGRQGFRWIDPVDDVRDETDPRVDLVNIEFFRGQGCLASSTLCLFYWPAQLLERPVPEPTSEWIAYGMVFDNDRDGVADGRYGIDNIPGDAFRAWSVDDRPGHPAEFKVPSSNSRTIDGAYGESDPPTTRGGTGRGYMWIRGTTASAAGETGGGFYLWAAVIRDGRLVSLDYAPDAGWLVAPMCTEPGSVADRCYGLEDSTR